MEKKILYLMFGMIFAAIIMNAGPAMGVPVPGEDPPPEEEPAPAEQPQTQPTTPDSLGELVVEMPDVPEMTLEAPIALPENEIAPAGEPAAAPAGLAGASPQTPGAEDVGVSGYDDIIIEGGDPVAQR